MSDIGKRIKERRLELHMSVDELAEKLGKNRATVYRYESNEIENMPLEIIKPLAKALHVTPQYLMGWDDAIEHIAYINPEVEELAQIMMKSPDLKTLMDAAKDLEREDIQAIMRLIQKK